MTEAQCIRIPLEPDAMDRVVDFIRGLQQRPIELREVLHEEGMLAEAVFLETGPEGSSLILFTKAKSLEAAQRALANSTHPIQQTMRELLGTAFKLDQARTLQILLDMTGPFEDGA